MESKVKPRYDKGGSEFGKIHRLLPTSYTMFDIDHIEAEAKIKLTATKEDYTFIEYRTDFETAEVNFIAMFEMKYKGTENVKQQIIERKIGTAIFAQMQMCRMLDMRYFYVVATLNKNPFHFIEIFTDNSGYKHVGTLDYDEHDIEEKIKDFYVNTLHI